MRPGRFCNSAGVTPFMTLAGTVLLLLRGPGARCESKAVIKSTEAVLAK